MVLFTKYNRYSRRVYLTFVYITWENSFYQSFVELVMFSDLTDFLDVDVSHLSKGQTILVVEISGSNGSFILHHLLSLALRGDTPVCFVGLAQTFHHYACIGNKLSLNLSRLRDSGKLVFVDGLNLIGTAIVQSSLPDQTGNKLAVRARPSSAN